MSWRPVVRLAPFAVLAVLLVVVARRHAGADVAPPPEPPTPHAIETLTPPTLATTETTASGPRRVTIGLYATAIPEIDIKAGTFTIDMYMWMVYAGDDTVEEFEIANGEILSKVLLERTTQGDRTYACWRVKATMHEHFSLADYPFDRQRLTMRFEHGSYESAALLFEPDLASYDKSGVPRQRWGLRGDVAIPEYEIVATEWRVDEAIYETNFGNPFTDQGRSTYSSAVFSVAVTRSFWPYCYKIIIPLFVILAIAYLVFFLPPDEIQSASGLAMTSLLTCVAMNLTVSSNLPEVGYLVASDKFFICTYVLIFVTLAETVVTFGVSRAGDADRAERIERWFRWGFPVATLLSFAWLGVAAVT